MTELEEWVEMAAAGRVDRVGRPLAQPKEWIEVATVEEIRLVGEKLRMPKAL